MFAPDLWPAYYQKAFGINIVTLDGIKMKDFSYAGIGACILGYKDEDVNIEWKHGILQMKPENMVDEGRISIIAWGWVNME